MAAVAYQAMARGPMASTAPLSPPSQLQPVSSLAIFAAQMITWLWFSDDVTQAGDAQTARPPVSKAQLVPSAKFRAFLHDVIATTQVSHSIVILALLFIYRLKSSNMILGVPGSEYRLAITALMLSNKVLDDNTYTAKTWADIAFLDLRSLVCGEAEFLRGLDWELHVSAQGFAEWIKRLQGHVAARESHLGPTLRSKSRKVGTRRGREMSTGEGGVDLLGLGLSVSASLVEGEREKAAGIAPPWTSNDGRAIRSMPRRSTVPHLAPSFVIPSPSHSLRIPQPHQPHPRQLRSTTAKRQMSPSWEWPPVAAALDDDYRYAWGVPIDAGAGPGSIASSERGSLSFAISPHYPQFHSSLPLRYFSVAVGQRQGVPQYQDANNGPFLAPTSSSFYPSARQPSTYIPLTPHTLPYESRPSPYATYESPFNRLSPFTRLPRPQPPLVTARDPLIHFYGTTPGVHGDWPVSMTTRSLAPSPDLLYRR